jgi:hypothetical protein
MPHIFKTPRDIFLEISALPPQALLVKPGKKPRAIFCGEKHLFVFQRNIAAAKSPRRLRQFYPGNKNV